MNVFDKTAKWISDGNHFVAESKKTGSPAVYLKKQFNVSAVPETAPLKICGLGLYEAYINGEKVGDRVLEPAFTEYDKRVLFSEYDAAKHLKKGENTVLVILGDGWYNQTTRDTWGFYRAAWRDCPKLLFELEVGKEKVVSDKSWSVSRGEIVSNAIRAGEYHDFNAEYDWRGAALTTPPGGILEKSELPPIRECEVLSPVSSLSGDNCVIYDFGKNITGYISAEFSGQKGEQIFIEYSDRVTGGRVDNASNSMYIFNAGLRYQTDGCTLSGGRDYFKPLFVYHGFRYAAVYGGKAENIKAYFVHTDLKRCGGFDSSSEILNKLYDMSINAVLGNYHGFPTDCPHREKNGWTGDAQLSLETCLFNFDMHSAYKKWLGDFMLNQRPSGQISAIIPSCGWGFNWGSGPAWDIAFFRLADAIYTFYGDKVYAEKLYPYLKKYYDYISGYVSGGLLCVGLGDWNYPKNITFKVCPTELTDSGYYKLMCEILHRFAVEFEPARAEEFSAAAKRAALAIKAKFAGEDSLTGLAAQSYFGIEDTSAAVVNYLVQNDYAPHCGILGAKFVFDTLARAGRGDIALKILERTEYPSFGYWIKNGQTTLCEDFELTNSLNHHMYSCIAEYMCTGLAGLKMKTPLTAQLQPCLPNGLTYVTAESHGFKVKVVRDNGAVKVSFTVPACGELIYNGKTYGVGNYSL